MFARAKQPTWVTSGSLFLCQELYAHRDGMGKLRQRIEEGQPLQATAPRPAPVGAPAWNAHAGLLPKAAADWLLGRSGLSEMG